MASDCACGRGVRGNENIVDGEIKCDYCCAEMLRGKKMLKLSYVKAKECRVDGVGLGWVIIGALVRNNVHYKYVYTDLDSTWPIIFKDKDRAHVLANELANVEFEFESWDLLTYTGEVNATANN